MYRLQNLSYWAYRHPRAARAIILFANLLMAYCVWQFAVSLFAADIRIPEPLFYLGLALIVGGFVMYPLRRSRYRIWRWTYVRHKTADAALLLGYVLAAATLTNAYAFHVEKYPEAAEARVIVNPENKIEQNTEWTWQGTRKQWKKQKREWRRSYREYLRERGKDRSLRAKIWLTVLLLISAFFIVLVLGCHISCSGGNPLFLFIIVGALFILFLFIIWGTKNRVGTKKNRYRPSEKRRPGY